MRRDGETGDRGRRRAARRNGRESERMDGAQEILRQNGWGCAFVCVSRLRRNVPTRRSGQGKLASSLEAISVESSMRPSDHPNPDARFWIERANAVRLKLNLGWWTECSGPMFVLGGIALFAGLFYLRSVGWQIQAWQGMAVGVGGMVAVAVIGLTIARRHFCTTEQAMVRLEARLHLHNALSTAAVGVGPWPIAHGGRPSGEDNFDRVGAANGANRANGANGTIGADGGVEWRMARVLGPISAYLLMCAVGLFVPVFADEQKLTMSEPMGWKQVESILKRVSGCTRNGRSGPGWCHSHVML